MVFVIVSGELGGLGKESGNETTEPCS